MKEFIDTPAGRFRVDPVVGHFDVWTHGKLPFAQFTLKVVKAPDHFRASPNVFVKNSVTKCIEYICGMGNSVEEAVTDAVDMFFRVTNKQEENGATLRETDFVWLNWLPYNQDTLDDGSFRRKT